MVKTCPPTAIAPLRAPPLFGAAVNCTVPVPLPLDPDGRVIQPTLGVAVHAQVPLVFTVNEPGPPPDPTCCDEGASEYVHPPSCVTVKVWPAIVTVPVRPASVFPAITSCTVPLPDPLFPEEIPIQLALLVAVHEQPPGAVTPTAIVPPPLAMFCVDADSVNEQPASCVTVNVRSPAVIVPVRDGPLLAAAAYCTDPFPLPVDPAVTVSQLALLAALQPHPSPERTSNLPEVPPDGADAVVGESANVQPCPWLTVTVRPATVSVPERAGPLVAAALMFTVPLPEPLAPDAIVIHDAWLAAVHAHPEPEVTLTLELPPDEATDSVCGATVNVQPADCTTVTVCPATVSVPVLAPPVVAAAVNDTEPRPLPPVPAVMLIHGACDAAVHAQLSPVLTFTDRVPPAASIARLSGVTSNAQPGDCVTVNVCPAIVAVPVRVGPFVAATVMATVPGPLPVGVAIESQLALLVAVHGQPGPALTVTAIDPPLLPAA